MKFPILFILLAILFAASPLAAKDSQSQFNTIVVNHFTNANGMNQSQVFINSFRDGLRSGLEKAKFKKGIHSWKVTNQALSEGATVSDADAANSLLIDGKFMSLNKGGMLTKIPMEINIYRISDHALIKTISTNAELASHGAGNDEHVGKYMGEQTLPTIMDAIEDVNLSSIPRAAPAVATTPTSTTTQAALTVFASVHLTSNPTGAEITIDSNYAGSTPSLIKLKPGAHSIKVTKNGYMLWVRSIQTDAGESRNLAADLEKTNQ